VSTAALRLHERLGFVRALEGDVHLAPDLTIVGYRLGLGGDLVAGQPFATWMRGLTGRPLDDVTADGGWSHINGNSGLEGTD
jgi:hypothetical protein